MRLRLSVHFRLLHVRITVEESVAEVSSIERGSFDSYYASEALSAISLLLSSVNSLFLAASKRVILIFDTGGEVDFRRDVLIFLSTKGDRYPHREGKISCFGSVFPHFLTSPPVSHK